jgi:ABC-type glycerol-3-phosphate transport system permease component
VTALRRRLQPRRIALAAVLVAIVLVTILPFVKMVLGSLQPPSQILGGLGLTLSWPPRFGNFSGLFSRLPIVRELLNSAIVSTAATALMLTVSTLAGYAFAKRDFPGKKLLFGAFAATMVIPAGAVVVPLFVTMRDLGWLNSYQALILPAAANGLGIFWMRQYIAGGVPDDLLDAARMDGARELTIVRRIVVPLCRPALATLGVLGFMLVWNDFLWPLISVSTPDMFTIQVGIASLRGVVTDTGNLGVQLAGATVASAVPLILFFALQRTFRRGVLEGALK